MSRRSHIVLTGALVIGAALFAIVTYDAWNVRRFVAMTEGTTELSGIAGALLITTNAVFYCGLIGLLSQLVGLVMLARQANPSGVAMLLLANAGFFVVIGPPIGAIVLFRDAGVSLHPPALAYVGGVIALAYVGGVIPALFTSALNALAIMSGFIHANSIRGRLLHATLGGFFGFFVTLLISEVPDWYLLQRTEGWYDVWYTFKRSYAAFSVAGFVAGAICSFIFNPWGERLMRRVAPINPQGSDGT